jgi:ORF6N domain
VAMLGLTNVDYEVPEKAVKAKRKRFSAAFMFQLTKDEVEALRFQAETLEQTRLTLR